ncbi:MAG TPA: hypothetical protein VKY37_13210 [Brumimicrobium sp.]|nr:hypothetical protein [Brumimicrobium sp.]
MKKKVLVIYYSQTGQLKEIAQNLVQPFEKNQNYDLDYYNIQPKKEFPFPWDNESFFGVFPESFAQLPAEIKAPPENILKTDYDLIILAYQIWFLTPSIPINSFMKSEYAEKLIKGKRVVTTIGCRNMWAKSQEKMKLLVKNVGGKLVGNVAFVDRHLNHISVITIVHWMMGGKKNKKFGILPKPGVSEKDIMNASEFGELIIQADQNNNYNNLQNDIITAGGSNIKPYIIFMDEKANKMFAIWSRFILKNTKNRKKKLKFFKIYLLTVIWIVSPIVYLIFLLTYPLRIRQIRNKKTYYSELN